MEFLTFRKFIAPVVIQVIFWLGVVGVVIVGVLAIVQGGRGYGGQAILGGILMIVFGPIIVRLYCEIIILWFRIYETLNAIRFNTQPQGQGYPPPQAYPPAQGQAYNPPPPPGQNPQRWQ